MTFLLMDDYCYEGRREDNLEVITAYNITFHSSIITDLKLENYFSATLY